MSRFGKFRILKTDDNQALQILDASSKDTRLLTKDGETFYYGEEEVEFLESETNLPEFSDWFIYNDFPYSEKVVSKIQDMRARGDGSLFFDELLNIVGLNGMLAVKLIK